MVRVQQLALATVLGFSLALAAPAHAAEPPSAPAKHEPSAGDLATARTALREGLVLREKGDLAEALMRLSSAYDLVPTPVTGFELGKTHLMLGHVLQAHELFKKVVRMASSMEESARSQTARDEAARLAKEIEPRIPSLRIRLTLPQGASAVVRLDEDTITTGSARGSESETVRAVDPGPHDVSAKAGDGPEEKVHVDVAEAETKDVALAPQWIPPKKPPASANGTPEIFIRSTNPLVYIGFGVAAASAVVTFITAVAAVNAHRDARQQCGAAFCPPLAERLGPQPPPGSVPDKQFTSDTTTATGLTLVSVVAGASTVIFAGVGIFGIRSPVKERVISVGPYVKPVVGLQSLGLTGTF
jgi:hypothetical protein